MSISATSAPRFDVIILGGGLAGLSLALQLRREQPSLSILVLERRRHPVPHAAHKVGESTVEIGANYFDTVLGLRDHLLSRQLKKFGFRFFFCDARTDIERTCELGASQYLATPGYQIDRGIFENFLAEQVRSAQVRFEDGATVRGIEVSQTGEHGVRYAMNGIEHAARARWLIDASGRAGLLKRKLDLAKPNNHDVNAVWFRIAARVEVDEWVADPAWRERCDPPSRWLSTNHLCGEGYWAWLIPLSSGSHSVGIVCDAVMHPLDSLNTFEKTLAWLRERQPRLYEDVHAKQHLLQDFLFLRNVSYGCKQVFSQHRWALTGEAGVFLDPFYSPGSDFIAIANTFIADLIARDIAGEPIGTRSSIYEQLYFSFYESTLALYEQQYRLFGDPEVLPVKVIWDYTYYWGILCQLFFQRRLTDLPNISRLSQELSHCKALNAAMQVFLREWSAVSAKRNVPGMLDQAALRWFAELNRGLRDELDEHAFRVRIKAHTRLLGSLAAEILHAAKDRYPAVSGDALRPLIVNSDRPLQPLLFH